MRERRALCERSGVCFSEFRFYTFPGTRVSCAENSIRVRWWGMRRWKWIDGEKGPCVGETRYHFARSPFRIYRMHDVYVKLKSVSSIFWKTRKYIRSRAKSFQELSNFINVSFFFSLWRFLLYVYVFFKLYINNIVSSIFKSILYMLLINMWLI